MCKLSVNSDLCLCCTLKAFFTEEEGDPCLMPLDAGDGSSPQSRYYYSPAQRKCLAFSYGGSGGNSNNFKTQEECRKACEPQQTGMPDDAIVAGQCPCVKSGSSTACVAYNPAYQAATLEEVLINFGDLSSPEPQSLTASKGVRRRKTFRIF